MTDSDAHSIFDFLDKGGEFEAGLELLFKVKPNPFYITNLRRKGSERAMGTVRYELSKAVIGRLPMAVEAEGREQRSESKDEIANFELPIPNCDKQDEGEKSERFVLRNEFPFLEREDCPEEFKVMVADMITAHHKYMNWHERLYYMENKGDDECFEVSFNVVENYLDNRMMWEELEHYNKTGTIHGKYRLFWRRKREKEITKLDPIALANLYRNYPRNINYYKKRIDEEKDNEQVFAWKERLSVFEWEYMIVKRLLHIHDGGLRRNKAGKAKGKGKRR